MIKSMTACGCINKDTPIGKLIIEILSINRKTLDMHFMIPKEFLRLEWEIRKWISERICRGQLQIRIQLKAENPITSQISRLQELKMAWEKAADQLGFNPKETVTLSFLAEQMQFSSSQIEDVLEESKSSIKENLKNGIGEALAALLTMKEKEGKAIAADIETRLQFLESELIKIEERAQFSVDKYREKLQDRMKEYQMQGSELDERILREVIIYAEKLDISEEKARLRSHIEQFRDYLKTKEPSIGKTMDFLTQEMNREANTIAAKSSDIELSRAAVIMKSEIEKIREQVQNIE